MITKPQMDSHFFNLPKYGCKKKKNWEKMISPYNLSSTMKMRVHCILSTI